jgi:hypothetical protein
MSADRRGERAAAVEESGKVRGGPGSWPHGAEFDVTAAFVPIGKRRSPRAERLARALPQQQGVAFLEVQEAEAARRDGADFRAEIDVRSCRIVRCHRAGSGMLLIPLVWMGAMTKFRANYRDCGADPRK